MQPKLHKSLHFTCFIASFFLLVGCSSTNTILVIDEKGTPISDAEVFYCEYAKMRAPKSGNGTTDRNGEFSYKGNKFDPVHISAQKEKYWGNTIMSPPYGIVVFESITTNMVYDPYHLTKQDVLIKASKLHQKRDFEQAHPPFYGGLSTI